MKRYLVTGAAGFIGLPLCRTLQARGDEVHALLRRPATGPWDRTWTCELGSEPLPSGLMEGIDGVFHLCNIAHAELAPEHQDRYRRVNVEGTTELLQAAVAAGVGGFVYFSSVKAAADPGEHCVDESWERTPDDPYGLSKQQAEQIVLQIGRASGMPVCNLRPALVYGPGVKGNLLRMLMSIERGRFPSLPEYHNRRSMISVQDVIAAACLTMNKPEANGRTYILEDGHPYSTRSIHEAMCQTLSVPIPRHHLPAALLQAGAWVGDGIRAITHRSPPLDSRVLQRLSGSACYCSGRIRRELGWQPAQTLPQVLPEIVRTLKERG